MYGASKTLQTPAPDNDALVDTWRHGPTWMEMTLNSLCRPIESLRGITLLLEILYTNDLRTLKGTRN